MVEVEMTAAPDTGAEMHGTAQNGHSHEQVEALMGQLIHQNVLLLSKAVETVEMRYTTRVLRTTAGLRKRWNKTVLRKAVRDELDSVARVTVESYLEGSSDETMALDRHERQDDSVSHTKRTKLSHAPPEVEIYFRLLTMIFLLDQGELDRGRTLADETVAKVQELNRRTLDQIAARVYYYFARFYELAQNGAEFAKIRPQLLTLFRTASLRRDVESQATLLNLLLRNYYAYNLVAQADALLSKSTLPEAAAGNGQIARYLYYLGRTRAIQLNYSEARDCLQQAIRKAPQPDSLALRNSAKINAGGDKIVSSTGPKKGSIAGFQQAAHKLFVIVELLMGDIPDRALFRQTVLRRALHPYFCLVQAVKAGNLESFQQTLESYEGIFRRDKTWTLILRLRHNVIKTALRIISLSYSRISLREICRKLQLDSEEDAEYIIGKAIRDGVIEAAIDHEAGFMQSKESADIYVSAEPGTQFNQRISFCMDLHNGSVKAMRFPINAHRKELKSAQEARERERELAKEIQDGELDEDADDFGDL